jgi:hypothetical protein
MFEKFQNVFILDNEIIKRIFEFWNLKPNEKESVINLQNVAISQNKKVVELKKLIFSSVSKYFNI